MDSKTNKLLTLLDKQIQSCTDCNLYENGRAKPWWTKNSKYMILLEAPGKTEVENNEVICGKIGDIFWPMLNEEGFTKADFLVMNSANCRSKKGNKNLIPSEYHRDCCRKWIRKYIKVFQIKKIVLMGNSAIHTITGNWGISKFIGMTENLNIFENNVEVIYSYHPSSIIYDKQKLNEIKNCFKWLKKC